MAAEESRAMVSVRGEASVTVPPDQALIFGNLNGLADSKAAVVTLVGDRIALLTADFAGLGGVPLTAQSRRSPLCWSVNALTTHAEHTHNKMTGEGGPTGRHQATVSVNLSVRDFALLDAVSGAIAAYDDLEMHNVQWFVDDDNPQWAQVRADAIHAALLKGRDYATALGGTVLSVEHVADAGLLGGDSASSHRHIGASAVAFGGQRVGAVALDPEPQVLTAIIEARFIATVGALPT